MRIPTAKTKTETKWAERVRAWRASGESGRAFALRHGYSISSLYSWASRVSRPEGPQFIRVIAKAPEPVATSHLAMPLALSNTAEVVIEVGSARVRIGAGFDRAMLADVLVALNGVSR